MIEIGKKYGCLTVLDEGEEYKTTEIYSEYFEEKTKCVDELEYFMSNKKNTEVIRNYIYKNYPSSSWAYDLQFNAKDDNKIPANVKSFWEKSTETDEEICESFIKSHLQSINGRIRQLDYKLSTRYKCQCKCGKIHYYDATTLEANPRYCFYPVSIANLQYSYSNRARNSNYSKAAKYSGLENVRLWKKAPAGRPSYYKMLHDDEDIDYSLPSEEYCELYNKYKTRELIKKEKKYNETVSQITRVFAANYDVDFTGKQYESLCIEECVNDHLESKPTYSFTQQHRKHWHNIVVYKQYKCKCALCGKEQLVNCSAFGIHPPTEYGYHAYNGYWSNVYCDCHPISSFQWIVTKLLYENDVPYAVEYSFDDLYGCGGVNQLRFDFAIFNEDGSIKCLIECQGEQHFKPVEEFGGQEQFQNQIKNDSLKRQYAKEHSIKLIEISYKTKKIEQIEDILRRESVLN